MTKEKILTNEILSEEQLDNISGGTVAQFNEIYSALEGQAGIAGKISDKVRMIGGAIPVAGQIGTAVWRNIMAPVVEATLKDCYGIDANIKIGLCGTGICESDNTYSMNGIPLTHSEVINTIKAG